MRIVANNHKFFKFYKNNLKTLSEIETRERSSSESKLDSPEGAMEEASRFQKLEEIPKSHY